MKKAWFWFWAEFFLFFRNPREFHRVLVVITLTVISSHSIYMYNKIPDLVWDTSTTTAFWLGAIGCLMLGCFAFLSNELTVDLFNRFAIVGALSVLEHCIIFYDDYLVSVPTYFLSLAFVSFGILLIWAMTGKSYSDFKRLYIQPVVNRLSKIFVKNEKKPNIYPIDNRDSAINE